MKQFFGLNGANSGTEMRENRSLEMNKTQRKLEEKKWTKKQHQQ